MVSFNHELLVELFRHGGDLAPSLLRRCIGMVIDHDSVEHRSIDLSQVVSTEYRADAIVVLRDRTGAAVAAIIVDIQLHVDRNKERTWPVYVAALYHKLGCPVILLVMTPKPGGRDLGSPADPPRHSPAAAPPRRRSSRLGTLLIQVAYQIGLELLSSCPCRAWPRDQKNRAHDLKARGGHLGPSLFSVTARP